jgi:ankyrin repeat protein
MEVKDIIKLEQPPPKVLQLLNEQVEGFDAVKWRDKATGESTLHLAIEAGRLKLVKLLLERGCDANATDLEGYTPLCSACKIGRLDMVKVMVGHGADVHNATYTFMLAVSDGVKTTSMPVHGMTALACALLYRHLEIVAYLVKQGVRLNSTALAVAIKADVATLTVGTGHVKADDTWKHVSHRHLRLAEGHPFWVCAVQLVLALETEGSFDSEFYRTTTQIAVREGNEQVGNKDDRSSRTLLY